MRLRDVLDLVEVLDAAAVKVEPEDWLADGLDDF